MSKYDSNKQHNAVKWVWILNAYRKVGKDENTNQNCSTDLYQLPSKMGLASSYSLLTKTVKDLYRTFNVVLSAW